MSKQICTFSFLFGLVLAFLAIGCTANQVANQHVSTSVPKDGPRIAFLKLDCTARVDCYFIHIIRADGTGEGRLTPQAVDMYPPAWSPDATKIAFNTKTRGDYCPQVKIMVINSDGSDQKTLATGVNPMWSPNGKQIAFADNSACGNPNPGIYVMNADGTQIRRIGNGDVPRWSPDGKHIVFIRGDWGISGVVQAEIEGYLVNPDGSGKIGIPTGKEWSIQSAEWSREGQVLLQETNDAGKTSHYHVFDPETGTVRDAPTEDLIWAPNRQHSFIVSKDGIRVQNADGSGQRMIDVSAYGSQQNRVSDAGDVSWSPDGKRIVYMYGVFLDGAHLYVVDLDHGAPQDITQGFYPVWAPK